jgi:hypothetical protein
VWEFSRHDPINLVDPLIKKQPEWLLIKSKDEIEEKNMKLKEKKENEKKWLNWKKNRAC